MHVVNKAVEILLHLKSILLKWISEIKLAIVNIIFNLWECVALKRVLGRGQEIWSVGHLSHQKLLL